MKELFDLQKKLVPDLMHVIQQRYALLFHVNRSQPIGRRAIAEQMDLTERNARSEIDFLHEQELIDVTNRGMYVTETGKHILKKLASFINEMMGLKDLEEELKEKLELESIMIVPGNSDSEFPAKEEIGKASATLLKTVEKQNNIIAVTGGSTMAQVAAAMTPSEKGSQYFFVPARGGTREKVESQANLIVSEMAKNANADYSLLYVPDTVSESAYDVIIKEPSIRETLEQIKSANIVFHGIGDALTLARRRKTPEEVIDKLKETEAVSEALGYYFDKDGNVVYKVKKVGIQLEDLADTDCVIAAAGGKSKAQAIASYFKKSKGGMLVTDEAAAREILKKSLFK